LAISSTGTAGATNMDDLLGIFGSARADPFAGAQPWAEISQQNGNHVEPAKAISKSSNEDILGLF
jgi:hypothetical protein